MNICEEKIFDILTDLKENHNAVGIKAEFETEIISNDEILQLKEISSKVGLDLTVKIGGCASIKDIYEAKSIGANSIVAPMIESSYAVKNFFETIKLVYDKNEIQQMNFFINIETVQGFNNLKEILACDFASNLKGIVFGRTDMVGSLGYSQADLNNNKILEYADQISIMAMKQNLEFIVGGGVSPSSIPFFKQLPYISKYETRKVIFDAEKSLPNNDEKGILKAIDFEMMWIKNKHQITTIDEHRLRALKNRYKNVISTTL